MSNFVAGMPAYCPGDAADEIDAVLFRACDTIPPTVEDVTSHAHSTLPRKRKKAKIEECNSWGLSCWRSMDDVRKDMALFHKWLPKKHVHQFSVSKSDGRLEQTGRPTHHTYWPYTGVNLLPRMVLVQP
jgi:hypothetical protein